MTGPNFQPSFSSLLIGDEDDSFGTCPSPEPCSTRVSVLNAMFELPRGLEIVFFSFRLESRPPVQSVARLSIWRASSCEVAEVKGNMNATAFGSHRARIPRPIKLAIHIDRLRPALSKRLTFGHRWAQSATVTTTRCARVFSQRWSASCSIARALRLTVKPNSRSSITSKAGTICIVGIRRSAISRRPPSRGRQRHA